MRVGGEVNAGQVIGLLEAMKLFNEIKSDVTGVVRRIAAESGALVKTTPDAHRGRTHVNLPRSVRITGWGAYAPETILTNADLARLVDTSDEWIQSRTGIRERRVAGPHETTATMAAIAGKRAVAVAGLAPDDIDIIVVATLTPDHLTPATAVLVKEAIGNHRAAAFDLGAACSGFVYGYATAHAYVQSGMARHVLVIGSELLTRYLDFTDRNTCVLFGDGAGAVVLSASDEEGGGLGGLELTADPSGAWSIWIPAGGARRPDVRGDRRGWRALPAHGWPGDLPLRDPDHRGVRAGARSSGPAGRPTRSTSSCPTRPTSGSSSRWPRAWASPWTASSSTSTEYGNTSAASVPIALVGGGRCGPAPARRQGRVRGLRRRLHERRGGRHLDRRPGLRPSRG